MKQMYCPKCDAPLVNGEEQRYETSIEHVCDPNANYRPLRPTWVCNNDKCPVSKEDIFWDETGDLYGWTDVFGDEELNSPYPSFTRKSDIEIYKKGLKKEIRLHPAFMLWLLQPIIEFNYRADEYGNILKRYYKLKWLRKDNWFKKDKFGYHTYYTFPLVSIYQHIKLNISLLYKCSDGYVKSEMERMFEPLPRWDKRWWRHVQKFLDKIIFLKYYILYLESKEE